jgi:hypothetical protein
MFCKVNAAIVSFRLIPYICLQKWIVVCSVSELQHEEEQKCETESSGLFGFGHLMSGVSSITRLVETTGNKVLTGGLDTLETIGRKTMEVLQEGDPGLKKKRALFADRPVLSQVLHCCSIHMLPVCCGCANFYICIEGHTIGGHSHSSSSGMSVIGTRLVQLYA